MKVTRDELEDAVRNEIISQDQAGRLYEFLNRTAQGNRSSKPSHPFGFSTVLYYMGGLIAIGAMTLFMNFGWEMFGGWGILFLSLAYAVAGLYLAVRFRNRGYDLPASLCAAFVIAITPLAIYGFQKAMGWWPDMVVYREYHHYIRWHWIYMEVSTLVVGAVVFYFFCYPFLLMPVAVTLWYMSLDVASGIAPGHADTMLRTSVTMWFGLVILWAAITVDLRVAFRSRSSGDYAFWLYMSGVAAFWGGMMSRFHHGEAERFLSLLINILLVAVGVVLVRRVFVVFGAMGCTFYLGHLAWSVFKNSLFFPFALTAVGFAIIYAGILWQRNEHKAARRLRRLLPAQIRRLLDERLA